ncbi:MAG: nitroreductase family protein, partial [Anaerolineales bacterium]|nr:nitroreductase family protein [Anaerolineales bacterium]
MVFSTSVSDLIRQRYSCRTYSDQQISPDDLEALEDFLTHCQVGPFNNPVRYKITSASEEDNQSLRNLGTYGFIKNPAGFLMGVIQDDPGALVDFGYQMERIIIRATELGIGTCWLGGTYTKSRFSALVNLQEGEFLPAVISLGYPADQQAWMDRISRIYAGADRRLPWENLFFTGSFNIPLPVEQTAGYQEPLHLIRLAPSASNKQPWRILKQGNHWHFYMERTKNYPSPLFN